MAVTAQIAERIRTAEIALWRELSWAVSTIDDDRYGTAARTFGSATAFLIHAIPHSFFNRVVGLRPEDHELVPEIVSFYSERQTPFRIDTSPFSSDLDLLARLYAEGCRPMGFQTTLYGSPIVRREELPAGIVVREVRPDEVESFADLFERAFNHGRSVPKVLQDFRRASIIARYRQPRWRFYFAIVEGMPAAGAIMHVREDVATLTGGATLPVLRGRGCQRALLLQRLAEASDLGCDLVVSTCEVGGTSQSNLERCGLATAYTKLIWEQGISSLTERRHLQTEPWVLPPRLLEEAS